MQRGHKLNRPDIPGVIEAVSRMPTTEDAIIFVRNSIGLSHATYQMAQNKPLFGPLVRTTYPAQWISRYLLRGYFDVDPVPQKGFKTSEPFIWTESDMGPRQQEFMADARSHGVGDKGYSIPIIDRFFRRSLLTLTTSAPTSELIDFVDANASGLTQIAHMIHHKAVEELLPTGAQPVPVLAPREAECLLWTARGKEAKSIAAILDLSEYTVRSYLRTARQKLECRTLSQAVAKAVKADLINP